MKQSLSDLLLQWVKRCNLPVGRISKQAAIPKQTLFNWLGGRMPRWHPQLPTDLARLSATLGLTPGEADELLLAAGCICAVDTPYLKDPTMKNLTAPRGWFRAGSHPKQYDMGLDPSVCCNEMATALVRSCSNTSDGFGTLMQSCKTGAFADTRVRFSAMTRTQGVDEWAGLWLRIDGPIQGESLNFDNMQDRALRGTSGWQRHSVTLDVPKETTKLAFGVLLSGQGSVWIADVHMETVGLDVPTTNLKLDEPNIPEAPVNLAFTDKPGHHGEGRE